MHYTLKRKSIITSNLLYLKIIRWLRGNFNPPINLTYLKFPEQSQSSTSHVLFSLMPSGCDSNSSILEKE